MSAEQVSIQDIWNVLSRRRRLVIGSVILMTVLSAVYFFLKEPAFRSEAVLQVEVEKSGLLIEQERDRFPSKYDSPVAAEVEIIRSRLILLPVVRELGLDVVPADRHPVLRLRIEGYDSEVFPSVEKPSFRVVFQSDNRYRLYDAFGAELGVGRLNEPFHSREVKLTLDAIGARVGQEVWFTKISEIEALSRLRKQIHVEEIGEKSNLVRIAVEQPDPGLAMRIVNSITDSYVRQHLAYRGREAEQTVTFLESQLAVIQGKLEKSEQELDNLKTTRGIIVLSEEAQRLIGQISRLEVNMAELTLRHRQLSHIDHRLRNAGKSHDPFLIGEASLADEMTNKLVGELSTLLVELRGLRQMYTDRTPRVRMLLDRVDELKSKIKAAVHNGKSATAAQLASAEKMISEYEDRLRKLPQAERELAAITRRSNVDAELYTFLLKKHEEARIAQAAVVGNLRVVDEGVAAEKPVSPDWKRLMLLGLLTGLMLGVGAAFAVEYTDDSVKSRLEAEEAFDLPILGAIPSVSDDDGDGLPRLDRMGPRQAFVEAFRTMRAGMLLAPEAALTRTVLCTSSEQGDGKSTVACNLAIAMARDSRKRVLLVDADLRRSGLHEIFQVEGSPGLAEALRGESEASTAITATGVEGLFLLPAGKLPDNPTALFNSTRLRELLFQLRAEFDAVVIDVPPAGLFSDSALIGSLADAAYLVVAVGKTRLSDARDCLNRLRQGGVRVQGVILTRVAGHAEDAYLRYYAENTASPTFLQRIRRYFLSA